MFCSGLRLFPPLFLLLLLGRLGAGLALEEGIPFLLKGEACPAVDALAFGGRKVPPVEDGGAHPGLHKVEALVKVASAAAGGSDSFAGTAAVAAPAAHVAAGTCAGSGAGAGAGG
eukprot:CAMPEP_0113944270 /NCGR_PEP_ID=MMETSP1339-20121228/32455_1 /TAXON_ID=94617 /ORGANISM="Fibrocapsa japonica" /LENGTH=114 /DNA_ID=CAMNT_0000949415 /DNA_START=126 /DNA_END=468 /DNA_ORIENTATION=- /assembly_acc=CAM_ASM_000762